MKARLIWNEDGSLTVLIPQVVMDRVNLKIGDEVEVEVMQDGKRILLKKPSA